MNKFINSCNNWGNEESPLWAEVLVVALIMGMFLEAM